MISAIFFNNIMIFSLLFKNCSGIVIISIVHIYPGHFIFFSKLLHLLSRLYRVVHLESCGVYWYGHISNKWQAGPVSRNLLYEETSLWSGGCRTVAFHSGCECREPSASHRTNDVVIDFINIIELGEIMMLEKFSALLFDHFHDSRIN